MHVTLHAFSHYVPICSYKHSNAISSETVWKLEWPITILVGLNMVFKEGRLSVTLQNKYINGYDTFYHTC